MQPDELELKPGPRAGPRPGRSRRAAPVITALLSLAATAGASDNGRARTPPMGWRDWNQYGCDAADQRMMETTFRAMVDTSRAVNGTRMSLRQLGYSDVGLGVCCTFLTQTVRAHAQRTVILPKPHTLSGSLLQTLTLHRCSRSSQTTAGKPWATPRMTVVRTGQRAGHTTTSLAGRSSTRRNFLT